MSALARLRPDNFTLALLATVLLASLLPARGIAAQWLDSGTDIAIAVLFFLHGARLPRQAIVAGLLHWRLHLLILACTFVLYPLLGVLARPLASAALTPELALGLLFLCALPSTVQSSIAFTSMAGGNVAAAVCSASLSSLLGVFLTPWLMTLLAGSSGAMADPCCHRQDHVAVAGAVRGRPPAAAVDRRAGGCAQTAAALHRPEAPSCWWSMPPSVRPCSKACGRPRHCRRCCLLPRPARCCWPSPCRWSG
jgi:Predicted Na+-dependent transporter